jgi:hypothetical protein
MAKHTLFRLSLALGAGIGLVWFGWVVVPFAASRLAYDFLSFLPVIHKAKPAAWDGKLLISEVMYDPLGPEPAREWVEVYSPGSLPITLSQYKIGDAALKGDREGMYRFPHGAVIQPDQVIVIANNADEFYKVYGRYPDFEFENSLQLIPTLQRYLEWSTHAIELTNTGDDIVILNELDQVVDAVSWGASDFAFSPPVAKVKEGATIERYPPYQDTDTALDWRTNLQPQPGSVNLTPPTATPKPWYTPTLTVTPTGTVETPNPGETPEPTPVPLLVINEIHADPHTFYGDANGDGWILTEEDKFVEIINMSGFRIDLSGWRIHNSTHLVHSFPDGSELEDGCAVVVFGGGAPEGSFGYSLVQTASTGSLDLVSIGDRLILADPSSVEIVSYQYGEEGSHAQSITRSPDISGPDPLTGHLSVEGSEGKYFSPGTKIDGSPFEGCIDPVTTLEQKPDRVTVGTRASLVNGGFRRPPYPLSEVIFLFLTCLAFTGYWKNLFCFDHPLRRRTTSIPTLNNASPKSQAMEGENGGC